MSGRRIWLPEAGLSGGEKAPAGFRATQPRPVQPKELGQPEEGRADKGHSGPERGEGRSQGDSGTKPDGSYKLVGPNSGGYSAGQTRSGQTLPYKAPAKLYSASGRLLTSSSRDEGPAGKASVLGADGLPAERTPYVTSQDIQTYNERQKSRKKAPPYRRLTELSPYNRGLAYMYEEVSVAGSQLEYLSRLEYLQLKPLIDYAHSRRTTEETLSEGQTEGSETVLSNIQEAAVPRAEGTAQP